MGETIHQCLPHSPAPSRTRSLPNQGLPRFGADPPTSSHKLRMGNQASGGGYRRPPRRAPWEDALSQVDARRLAGPFPFDEDGKLGTGLGPHLANPAFRFGAQQGGKLRASDHLKRSLTNRGTAAQTSVNHPTRDHLLQPPECFEWGVFRSVWRRLAQIIRILRSSRRYARNTGRWQLLRRRARTQGKWGDLPRIPSRLERRLRFYVTM